MAKQPGLRIKLKRDIDAIWAKGGLDPAVDRRRFDVLAALAEATSKEKGTGETVNVADVVERLLHQAIDASVSDIVHPTTPDPGKIRQGLRELLDVGQHPHIRFQKDR